MDAYIRGARYSAFAHIRSRHQSRPRFVTYGLTGSIRRAGQGVARCNTSRGGRRRRRGRYRVDAIFSALSDDDPCLVKYCGAGRECQVSADGERNVAECVCVRRCARRHRPVCASNGRVYVNHCEMHRAACNSGTQLTIRSLSRCLGNGEHVPGRLCLT